MNSLLTTHHSLLFALPPPKKAIRKIRPEQELLDKKKKQDQWRYYIHRNLDPAFELDANAWNVKLPYTCFSEIPKGQRYWINQLRKLKYSIEYQVIQYKLL